VKNRKQNAQQEWNKFNTHKWTSKQNAMFFFLLMKKKKWKWNDETIMDETENNEHMLQNTKNNGTQWTQSKLNARKNTKQHKMN